MDDSNSSAVEKFTIYDTFSLNNEQIKQLKSLEYIIWFSAVDKNHYKILSFEDAYAKYCIDVKAYNNSLEPEMQYLKELEYDNFASFKDDIIDGINPHSEVTGLYLTFPQLMTFVDIDKLNELSFNVFWKKDNWRN